MLFPNHHGSFCLLFSDTRLFTFICLFLISDRRKFGLVCALLNQCVYILFVLLLMIMMKKQVDAKGQNVSCFVWFFLLRIKTKHPFPKLIYRVINFTEKCMLGSNACPLTYRSLQKLASLGSHISMSLHRILIWLCIFS